MASEQDIKNTETLIALLREQGKSEQEIQDLLRGRSANYEEQIALLQEQLAYATDIKEQQELSLQLAEREAALKVKNGEMSRAEYERLKASLKLQSQVADEWDNIFQTFTGISAQWESSALGKLITNPQEGFAGLINSFKRTFTVSNMLGTSLMKVQEATLMLTMQTDAALAEFNKATGATRLYGDQIMELERDMYSYGVSIGDAAQTYGSLVREVTGFNQLSAQQQSSMSKTVGILNELGVNSDLTASNIQTMTRVMGISNTEAASFSREMFTLAQSIGMPPEEMAAAFKAASPQLAKFGSQSTDVFKKLAVNAREAGMEVEQILSIVEKFDTFEGAAESVGKLNAILGGPFLNSLEMIKATDPVERMRLLSDAATDAGKSFDDMGYYERLALTEAMGLKDVSELALVMAGDFDTMADSTMKSQSELADLARQQKDFNTLADEAAQVARMFAMQLKPLVDIAKTLLQGIQDINMAMGGKLVPILVSGLAIIKGLTLATKAYSAATTVLVGLQRAMGVATVASNVAVGASAPIVAGAGAAAGAAATPMYAFAGAALAVGAAFALVGIGIGAAALGMSFFMSSLGEIPVTDMFSYGVAIYNIAGAMGALSAAMFFGGGFGLGILVASVTSLGLALKMLDQAKLNDLALLFNSIQIIMNSTAENLTAVKDTINDVVKSVGDMQKVDMEKAVVVKELIQAASGQAVSTTTAAAPAGSAAGTGSGQPVVLQIDLGGERILTRVVANFVGGMLNPLY